MERINKYLDQLVQLTVAFAPKLLLAALALALGWWLTSRITQLATKTLAKSQVVNAEIKAFLSSLLSIGLKILLLISVAGIVGIETTSFVGLIAAMGFAVGLA